MLLQKCQIRAAAAHRFQKIQQARQGFVRPQAALCGGFGHTRNQQIEAFLRVCRQTAVFAAAFQLRERAGQRSSLHEAQFRQCLLHALAIFGQCLPCLCQRFGSGVLSVGFRLVQRFVENAGDIVAVLLQAACTFRPRSKTHALRQPLLLLRILRQRLRLLVVPILQAVLHIAQEAVGRQQLCHRFVRQNARFRQLFQRFLRAFQLQAAVLPAANHLENLRDKFNFADAARAQFDIVVHLAFLHFLPDLAVQLAHGMVGVVVQIFAEHERAHQRGNAVFLRRDNARLAPGIALPFAPLRDQILLQCRLAAHQCAAVAVRPQAHVDAEHLPVFGNVVQQRNQFLPHFGEKFLIGTLAFAVGAAVFRIDENQIQIGRHVQLEPARLAHGHNSQMLRLLRICADGRAVQACVILMAEQKRGVGGEIGEFGNRARYLCQIGQAAKVARHDVRHHVAAQKPQLPCQFRFVFARQNALPVGKGGEIFWRKRARQPVVQPRQIQALMVELPRQPLRMRVCFFQQGVCHCGFFRVGWVFGFIISPEICAVPVSDYDTIRILPILPHTPQKSVSHRNTRRFSP